MGHLLQRTGWKPIGGLPLRSAVLGARRFAPELQTGANPQGRPQGVAIDHLDIGDLVGNARRQTDASETYRNRARRLRPKSEWHDDAPCGRRCANGSRSHRSQQLRSFDRATSNDGQRHKGAFTKGTGSRNRTRPGEKAAVGWRPSAFGASGGRAGCGHHGTLCIAATTGTVHGRGSKISTTPLLHRNATGVKPKRALRQVRHVGYLSRNTSRRSNASTRCPRINALRRWAA